MGAKDRKTTSRIGFPGGTAHPTPVARERARSGATHTRVRPETPPGQPLQPGELAVLLDRWALRREKCLDIIDMKASRKARSLAQRCRDLSRRFRAIEERPDREARESCTLAWLDLRAEVGALLSQGAKPNVDR